MTLQYILSGGQLYFDKKAFTGELLLPKSPMKKILNNEAGSTGRQPRLTKTDQLVTIDYNEATDIILDEGFYDLFKHLKSKYREKLRGRIVIQITALTSYHVVLNLNSDDDKVIYE